jgi:hypothetical protein
MRILIVGGYGTFGGRLVELLEGHGDLTLLIGGRSLARARAYCARRKTSKALLVPTRFERSDADLALLEALRVALLVDASGPFQAYGSDPYALVKRCIDSSVNYLDLADGSDFVAGIHAFDEQARARGVFVLSGVSSFPVLTAAVVRRLAAGMSRIDGIRAGIAPSPFARVGGNVIRAIAGYAGQRIDRRRSGRAMPGYPFTEHMRFVIAVPGKIPLERRRFSLVDVPDLRALALLWPEAQDIWMGAAPVPAALHRVLTMLAWLVRLRLFPRLSCMAGLIHYVTNHVRWGEHRGGMFVEVRGRSPQGSSVARDWHLLAEGDDGPLIPSMAVAALVGDLRAGKIPSAGARAAVREVELAAYETLFQCRRIYTGIREHSGQTTLPLFARLLGPAWSELPGPLRVLHSVASNASFTGRCRVERGRGPLAWLIATLVGFPRSGENLGVRVQIESTDAERSRERWIRRIGDSLFSSRLEAASKGSEWLLRERFGPVSIDMALVIDGACLRYIIRRFRFCGIALPRRLGPTTSTFESVENGLFHFDVEIGHPLVGRIVRYRGALAPDFTPQS